MGYNKFNKDLKSSLFKESKNIVFVGNYIWESLRFYFKKTKSIKSFDVVLNNDMNGYNAEKKKDYLETIKNNLNLK